MSSTASYNFEDATVGNQFKTTDDKGERAFVEGDNMMAVIDHTGDSKHVWSTDSRSESKAARQLFTDMLKKGFSAFRVSANGKKAEMLHSFDPEAGRIIFAPALVGG